MPERNSERIHFGTIKKRSSANLIEVQLNSYLDFLQKDVAAANGRTRVAGCFKEVFPIESYDEKAVLDFSHYESASRN